MADTGAVAKKAADVAIGNEEKFKALVDGLSASSRRVRQGSAAALSLIAKENADLLVPFSNEIVDALNRPEAQTRWECLDILTNMVEADSRSCDKAIQGAETALFDEESGLVRLAALRFLCKLGSTTENRSEKVWPLLDEAIQCYHGDFEFQDMLIAITDFASGKISQGVKDALAERMSFDAANGKGALKRRAQAILDNLK